jgi:hypothetical protein
MDISTSYKSIAPHRQTQGRHAIPPAKSPQDRRGRQKRREKKSTGDDDVVVTLSGRAPSKARGED